MLLKVHRLPHTKQHKTLIALVIVIVVVVEYFSAASQHSNKKLDTLQHLRFIEEEKE
ncbi:MAG: hypothetical protein ACQETH_09925 [Candidatus Rifleibacteriota bacterium]